VTGGEIDGRFTARERLALEYADAMTVTGREVSDELFGRLRSEWPDDALVILTEVIAWENASSKFNRAFRVPSQRLWERQKAESGKRDES
jgi:alkylhydroperoxidase family enzyme